MDRLQDNRIALGGRVLEAPRCRYSPAGIPIVQFTLEHRSGQCEGDARRPVAFLVAVRASGGACAEVAGRLAAGEAVRVVGFLARARAREHRLLISASRIERLADEEGTAGV